MRSEVSARGGEAGSGGAVSIDMDSVSAHRQDQFQVLQQQVSVIAHIYIPRQSNESCATFITISWF